MKNLPRTYPSRLNIEEKSLPAMGYHPIPAFMEYSDSYKKAGVDTAEGRRFVQRIAQSVTSTHTPNVLASRSGFAGLYDVSFLKDYRDPVLLSTTDGVGTKLRLAQLFNRHDTIGIDLVAMCANDILVTGARSLLFLDYIACGRLDSARMAVIVESIAEGLRRCGASLVGGETAEHPDTMEPEDYDLAGFMVGCAERNSIIDGGTISAGDLIVSIPSTGVHSNGLSLIRRIFLKDGLHLPDSTEEREFLLNQVLLRPTAIYERALRPLFDSNFPIHGLVHITGGGFTENIPRILPEGVRAVIDTGLLSVPDFYSYIRDRGGLDEREIYSVFNMGTGMAAVIPEGRASEFIASIKKNLASMPDKFLGEPYVMGSIEKAGEENGRIVFS
jgi:phosphoribosylformylglycinamidine cyclo-ligase